VAQLFIVLERAVVELILEVVHLLTQFVGGLVAVLALRSHFVIYVLELQAGVLLDARDDLLHLVRLVLRDGAVRLNSEFLVFLVAHCQSEQYFHRTGGHSAFIGRRILEQQDAVVLQPGTHILADEEVGPLHNILKAGHAVFNQSHLVSVVDGLGAAPARNEDV